FPAQRDAESHSEKCGDQRQIVEVGEDADLLRCPSDQRELQCQNRESSESDLQRRRSRLIHAHGNDTGAAPRTWKSSKLRRCAVPERLPSRPAPPRRRLRSNDAFLRRRDTAVRSAITSMGIAFTIPDRDGRANAISSNGFSTAIAAIG